MRRWVGPLVVLSICALAAHGLVLHLAPGLIMARAMQSLEQRGVALHSFTAPQRITPQTQSIVRPSPDLYYALCRYDLDKAGAQLRLHMAAWPEYQSLSFFDARTDNFAVLRGAGKSVSVRLLPPGSAKQQGAIISPTQKGVILIRRLAPGAARFDAAAAVGRGDACDAI